VARVGTRLYQENVKLANALVLLIGGTPFTYYGEEIGMEDLKHNSITFEQCQDEFGKSLGVSGH
jgi:glycosidase